MFARHRNSVFIGIGIVILATAVARTHELGFDAIDVLGWAFWVEGITTGAVVGSFFWILLKPRERFTKGMLFAVAINWAAWAAFLVTTPRLDESEVRSIAEERALRDADGPLNFITDRPTVLAGRWFGGYTAMPICERWLFVMARVPVGIFEQHVVPARYVGTPPIGTESYVVAVAAFILSTAFWTAFTRALGSIKNRWLGVRQMPTPLDKRTN